MIELTNDSLVCKFPDVHPDAKIVIHFQRTFRIPDDDNTYPLPPGLGRFPLRHVDDFAESLPAEWLEHGGVMLPMYQSEALWLRFDPQRVEDRATDYPFAIKVAAGKVNAVTGAGWSNGLHSRPQDYMVAPTQPWLDGFFVEKGVIRQFVAMPLGAGYTAEEQITGSAEVGGLQIILYPMKRSVFEQRFAKRVVRDDVIGLVCSAPSGMGLAPGGRMKQDVYRDPFGIDDWDQEHGSRCFVHLVNSLVWRTVTDQEPPLTPLTAKKYNEAGLPWFEYYDDKATFLGGAEKLKQLKSILALGETKKGVPLPENDSTQPRLVVQLGRNQVREGAF